MVRSSLGGSRLTRPVWCRPEDISESQLGCDGAASLVLLEQDREGERVGCVVFGYGGHSFTCHELLLILSSHCCRMGQRDSQAGGSTRPTLSICTIVPPPVGPATNIDMELLCLL